MDKDKSPDLKEESPEYRELEGDVEVLDLPNGGEGVPPDPFGQPIEKANLGRNLRRRVARLEKQSKGVGSKALPQQFLTSYDVLQLVPPPWNLDNLAKLYEQNSAHNAAVTIKAINICGLGYQFVESPSAQMQLEDMNQTQKKDFMQTLKKEKIKLDQKLSEMNDDEEFSEIMTKVWMDVESLGTGYLEIARTLDGSIGYLGHIPGSTMRIRAKGDGFVQIVSNKYIYFRNYGDSLSDDPTPDPLGQFPGALGPNAPNEVIAFKKYSPNSSYYGVPDIVSALTAVLGDKYAREFNIDYFQNKAVPRYAFIVKGAKLSAKAEENLINFFKNELKGKNHSTLYIPLPANFNQNVEASFQALENNIQESSFTNYIRENRQEVLMVHRTPPGKVGVFLNMNLAIARDADRTFKEQVCRPEQRRVEKKINKMMKEWTKNFVFKFVEADVIDADIQSRIHDRYLRTTVLTPNDVLNDLGRPTRPDGNAPLPFQPQKNQGGGGAGQPARSTDTSQPTRAGKVISPAHQVGTAQERGTGQDQGRIQNPK